MKGISVLHRRAVALVVTLLAAMVGVAVADSPEGGFQAGVTINVTPSDGLTSPATVRVAGLGFGAGQLVDIVECDAGNPQRCSEPITDPGLVTDANGAFTITVQVTSTFKVQTVPNVPDVNCLVAQCFVEAARRGTIAQHHINFQGGISLTTTTTSTTLAPPSTSSTTSTTRGTFVPPTTITSTTAVAASDTSISGTRLTFVTPGPTTTMPAAASVAVPVSAALARTGSGTWRMVVVGLAFVVLGLALRLLDRARDHIN